MNWHKMALSWVLGMTLVLTLGTVLDVHMMEIVAESLTYTASSMVLSVVRRASAVYLGYAENTGVVVLEVVWAAIFPLIYIRFWSPKVCQVEPCGLRSGPIETPSRFLTAMENRLSRELTCAGFEYKIVDYCAHYVNPTMTGDSTGLAALLWYEIVGDGGIKRHVHFVLTQDGNLMELAIEIEPVSKLLHPKWLWLWLQAPICCHARNDEYVASFLTGEAISVMALHDSFFVRPGNSGFTFSSESEIPEPPPTGNTRYIFPDP